MKNLQGRTADGSEDLIGDYEMEGGQEAQSAATGIDLLDLDFGGSSSERPSVTASAKTSNLSNGIDDLLSLDFGGPPPMATNNNPLANTFGNMSIPASPVRSQPVNSDPFAALSSAMAASPSKAASPVLQSQPLPSLVSQPILSSPPRQVEPPKPAPANNFDLLGSFSPPKPASIEPPKPQPTIPDLGGLSLMDDSMSWSQAPKPASPVKEVAPQLWSEPLPTSPVKSQPASPVPNLLDMMSSQVQASPPKEAFKPVVPTQPVVSSHPISMKTLLYSSEAQGLKVEVGVHLSLWN